MPTQAHSTPLPTPEEICIARESSRTLSAIVRSKGLAQEMSISNTKGSVSVKLPDAVLRLLIDILSEMGNGNAVRVMPTHAELTTQEAADELNVSRPYLVKLLDNGDIPCRKVGTHRRVKYLDLLDYKKQTDKARCDALDALAQQAQQDNMGY